MKRIKEGLLLTRRDLFKALGLGALGGIGYGYGRGIDWLIKHRDSELGIIYDDFDSTVCFAEAAQLARRLNKAKDAIPSEYRPDVQQMDLYDWAYLLLPMYRIEGATERANLPRDIEFAAFWDEAHDRVRGRSDCQSFAILNRRFKNDHSGWYADLCVVAVLAHELAHTQQGYLCEELSEEDDEARALIENTAQIVSWEVLAALANSENAEAAFALVEELFDVAMTAARYAAMRANAEWLYDALVKWLEPKPPARQARYARSLRWWQERGDQLEFILKNYYSKPLAMVLDAHRNHGDNVHNLALKPDYIKLSGRAHPVPRIFVVDDLMYFIQHCKRLVPDLAAKWRKWEG